MQSKCSSIRFLILLIMEINHFFVLLRNVDGVDEEQTDFISVFVYDDTLRNIVRNQLKRLDRVRVEGVLKYKACIDDTGKKQYQGYILANRIAKLMKLQRIVDTEAQLLKEQAIE